MYPLLLLGLVHAAIVAATSSVATFSDKSCRTRLAVTAGPDDGLCHAFASAQSISIVAVDPNCAGEQTYQVPTDARPG
jgi:hypothetical protein